MSGEKERNTPNLKSLEGLVLRKPMSWAGHQLQQNFQTLSMEVAAISTRLEEVLVSLRPATKEGGEEIVALKGVIPFLLNHLHPKMLSL